MKGKSTPTIKIERPSYSRGKFDQLCKPKLSDDTPLVKKAIHSIKKSCQCSKSCLLKGLNGFFPFVSSFHGYNVKSYLYKDILAGINVGMIHIPQGMGFAVLASLAPIYGLYSSFFPVLLYFFFGSSRHISVGTMAILSIIVADVVNREAEMYVAKRMTKNSGDTVGLNVTTALISSTDVNKTTASDQGMADFQAELDVFKASVASGFTLISGAILFLMGVFRLGIIKTFMPNSFIGGFTTAAAFVIVTNQLKGMLGLKASHTGYAVYPRTWITLLSMLPQANVGAIVVTIICVTILVFFKEFINVKYKRKLPIPVPVEMIVLILSTAISFACNFNQRWGIAIVGEIPKGFPAPAVPALERADTFISDAFIAAILCFAISISMADILARKHSYSVDKNQELIAYGISYGLSAFFHCFIGAAAPPRCFVQDSTGAKTQIAGLSSCILLLIVILFLGPLFKSLPVAALASIITVALFPLFKQFKDLPHLWKLSKADFSIWVVTLLVSLFIDLTYGLIIGMIWSLATVPVGSMINKGLTLGESKQKFMFAPTQFYQNLHVRKRIAIFRYEGNLYYPTIENFKRQLFHETVDPGTLEKVHISEEDHAELMDSDYLNFTLNPTSLRNVFMQLAFVPGAASKKAENPKEDKSSSNTVNGSDPIAVNQQEENNEKLESIIIDCSPIAYIDCMGLSCLRMLSYSYKIVGIRLVLAACTNNVIDKLSKDDQIDGVFGDVLIVYPTISDAIVDEEKAIEKSGKF